MNNFFCLGLACLLNKPKTNVQAWFIYKLTLTSFLSSRAGVVHK